MFRLIGPVQAIVGIVEPKISDMAVNRHNNNIFHHHQQNSNFILTYSQYTNLAIFIFLFFILAIEVIFVKIVTAINMDEQIDIDIDGETYPLIDMDLLNLNNIRLDSSSLSEVNDHHHPYIYMTSSQHQAHLLDQQHQRQRSVVAHLISTQSLLQRISAQASPFGDINNNNSIMINNNNV